MARVGQGYNSVIDLARFGAMSALRFSNPLPLLRALWIRLLPQREPFGALEERIAKLEAEVAVLKHQEAEPLPWWGTVAGTFENDAMFDEAMRLGALSTVVAMSHCLRRLSRRCIC